MNRYEAIKEQVLPVLLPFGVERGRAIWFGRAW